MAKGGIVTGVDAGVEAGAGAGMLGKGAAMQVMSGGAGEGGEGSEGVGAGSLVGGLATAGTVEERAPGDAGLRLLGQFYKKMRGLERRVGRLEQ